MIKKLTSAVTVLKRGNKLRSVEAWKNTQAVASFVAALVVAIGAFFGTDVSGVDGAIVDSIATGLSGLVVSAGLLFNTWTTLATSDKVGVGKLQSQPEARNRRSTD